MDELIEWLRAELTKDERTAHAAAKLTPTDAGAHPHHWEERHESTNYEPWDWSVYCGDKALIYACGTCEHGGVHGDLAAHIARHDPARVLAEVEAKRRIIDEGDDRYDGADEYWRVLSLLALPYADRPGYKPEWRP